MRLYNDLPQRQQILLIDGTAIDVPPKKEVEINCDLLYEEEKERVKKCFRVKNEGQSEMESFATRRTRRTKEEMLLSRQEEEAEDDNGGDV